MVSHPNRGLIRLIRRVDDATISVYGPRPAVPYAGARPRKYLGMIFCGKRFECVVAGDPVNDATFDSEESAIEHFRAIARKARGTV